MAADWTPADMPSEGESAAPDATTPPRSIRPILLAAVLALAAMWSLGSSALGGEIQHAIQHALPGVGGGCGEPGPSPTA